MKHTILVTLCVTLLLQACKKNGKPGGGTPGSSDVMYPITLSFYEGNNSAYPQKSTFKYDDKHQLTWFGNNERYTNVASNGTQLVILGADTLIDTYLYSGNIYTGEGVERVTSSYLWKYSYGSHYQGPFNTYYFTNTDATHSAIGSYNDNTNTQFFTYDANGNLAFSRFVTDAVGSPNSTSYNPGGFEFVRITCKGYDDKLSPYSAIPGWRYISYVWAYPWQYYLSMRKHNPTQIIQEDVNMNTMKWEVYSQSDLTYTYNDQGYPAEVKITTTYPSTATPNQAFYQTYDFTYSK